ncbi:beta-1,3-galactosyltransferase 6 isoform X2 [Epargyreus clarus]|uniref:beta-1,3-galactosyltransferase 6 isoform X2 n=1 Tax=Epargyreus clarus TaxID=520877 RepID=UPI003C2F465D
MKTHLAHLMFSKRLSWLNSLNKYKNMIFVGVAAFYLGCSATLSIMQMDCQCTATKIQKMTERVEYPVIVLSGPNNEDKRDAIRATWAKLANNIFVENGETLFKWNCNGTKSISELNIIKIYFIIGAAGLTDVQLSKLTAEQKRHNDVVLIDNLEDSYKNLAQKMLLTLTWVNEKLSGYKYLVKCDDDSFVRIDLIVKDLEAFGPDMSALEISKYVTFKHTQPNNKKHRGLYWGYFDGRARVYQSGKWQEQDWFLCDTYLPYALGGAYVISSGIIDYVALNGQYYSTYRSEDVSMGVWTAALDNINRVHDIRFDTEWKSRGCDAHMLVRHKQTPKDMYEMYDTLVHSQGKSLCKNESTVRKFYHYNWDVLPSKCCK